jgi:cytoskeleton protein RodZ
MADERAVDFGTFLRQAREARGISLQQVSVTTRISARVLDALERNDPSKLPGGIFSRAFVRSYAREVGLDPDLAVSSFVAAFPEESGAEEMPSATTAEDAETFQSRRRVATTLVQLLVISLVVVVLGLIYISVWGSKAKPAPGGSGTGAVPPVRPPAEAKQSIPAPVEATLPAAAAGGVPEETPAAASAAPQSPATPPQPDGPADSPTGSAVGQAAPLVVGLAASDRCWLSITVDGARIPGRNLQAGERLEYRVRAAVTMIVGNAAALAITLNGKPARALGGPGQVVTTTITAESFQTFLQQP